MRVESLAGTGEPFCVALSHSRSLARKSDELAYPGLGRRKLMESIPTTILQLHSAAQPVGTRIHTTLREANKDDGFTRLSVPFIRCLPPLAHHLLNLLDPLPVFCSR